VPGTERVRDPIHQFIYLPPEEWRAVDTPVFQRLRRIAQLAMTHLVYPGTTHTRFEHSIGVRDVARRLCERLDFSEEERRPVLHAALLHDVGHGPFSHVSEQVLDQLSGASNVHEAISVTLIRSDEGLNQALGEEACNAAADIVEGRRQTVERDIVSGATDADKLDYLLRDTYFAGAKYGLYDIDRIIESAKVVGQREAQTFLGFDIGGLWAVEGLLLARHHMWRQVYGHKTRLATDVMITRALLAGIEQEVLPREAFNVPIADGKPHPTQEFISIFLEQTDASVLEQLRQADEGTPARDLVDRLRARQLLRQTETVPLHHEQPGLDPARRSYLQDPEQFTTENIQAAEEEIATEVRLAPHLVAIYIDRWSNPTYRRPGIGGGRRIPIIDGSRTTFLDQESEIFHSEVREEHAFLYLYMPEVRREDERRAKEVLWRVLRND
jgi:uncharacterized protein